VEWPESGQWVVLFEPSSTDLVVLDLPEVIDWGNTRDISQVFDGSSRKESCFLGVTPARTLRDL